MKTSIGLLIASMAIASQAMAKAPQPTGIAKENVLFCFTEKSLIEADHSVESQDFGKLITHMESGMCSLFNGNINYTVIPAQLVTKKKGVYAMKVRAKGSENDLIVFAKSNAMEWK